MTLTQEDLVGPGMRGCPDKSPGLGVGPGADPLPPLSPAYLGSQPGVLHGGAGACGCHPETTAKTEPTAKVAFGERTLWAKSRK